MEIESRKIFKGKKDPWVLSFELDGKSEKEFLKIVSGNETVLSFEKEKCVLSAKINTLWKKETERFGKDPKFEFLLKSPVSGRNIKICWLGFSVRLYVDNVLIDEDWPLGYPDENMWEICASDGIKNIDFSYKTDDCTQKDTEYRRSFQGFSVPGFNTLIIKTFTACTIFSTAARTVAKKDWVRTSGRRCLQKTS